MGGSGHAVPWGGTPGPEVEASVVPHASPRTRMTVRPSEPEALQGTTASPPALPFMPALDGVRGAAMVVVLLYHSGYSWVVGGHLGVTSFFVLSGFLITGLMLCEREREGRIRLRAFWARRACRLAPGAVLGVAVATAYL